MKIALLKKYFRLAIRLISFTPCKKLLNLPPPTDEKYFLLIQDLAMQAKKQNHAHLDLDKNKATGGGPDFSKLLSSKTFSDNDFNNFSNNASEQGSAKLTQRNSNALVISQTIKKTNTLGTAKINSNTNDLKLFKINREKSENQKSKSSRKIKSVSSYKLKDVYKYNTHEDGKLKDKKLSILDNANKKSKYETGNIENFLKLEDNRSTQEKKKPDLGKISSNKDKHNFIMPEKQTQDSSELQVIKPNENNNKKTEHIDDLANRLLQNSWNKDSKFVYKSKSYFSNKNNRVHPNNEDYSSNFDIIQDNYKYSQTKPEKAKNKLIQNKDNVSSKLDNDTKENNIQNEMITKSETIKESKDKNYESNLETNRLIMDIGNNNMASINSSYYGITLKNKENLSEQNLTSKPNIPDFQIKTNSKIDFVISPSKSQEINNKLDLSNSLSHNNIIKKQNPLFYKQQNSSITEKDDDGVSNRLSSINFSKHKATSPKNQENKQLSLFDDKEIKEKTKDKESASDSSKTKMDRHDLKLLDDDKMQSGKNMRSYSNVSSQIGKDLNNNKENIVMGIKRNDENNDNKHTNNINDNFSNILISNENNANNLSNNNQSNANEEELNERERERLREKEKEEESIEKSQTNNHAKEDDFSINVQMIIIDSLRSGEHVYYCLCLLLIIPDNIINTDNSE